MALDTRDKRFSMIGFASPYVREMKNPDGVADVEAREMLLFLYAGISLSPPPLFNPAWAIGNNTVYGITTPPEPTTSG